jgi:hypothetical protein
MIRQISTKDKIAFATYLVSKLNISYKEANKQAVRIIKSGFPALMLEARDLQGACWVENKIVNEKKMRYITILVNNWRLAEAFLQMLRWKLNGEYWFELPKHDFLNKTYNKNGVRFMRVQGNKNIYCYRFELRTFYNVKNEDDE